jgi:hypothetical protein
VDNRERCANGTVSRPAFVLAGAVTGLPSDSPSSCKGPQFLYRIISCFERTVFDSVERPIIVRRERERRDLSRLWQRIGALSTVSDWIRLVASSGHGMFILTLVVREILIAKACMRKPTAKLCRRRIDQALRSRRMSFVGRCVVSEKLLRAVQGVAMTRRCRRVLRRVSGPRACDRSMPVGVFGAVPIKFVRA